MKLTIKRRIMLLYTLLTTILLGILLPIVYVTVSASLNLDIQSRLNNVCDGWEWKTHIFHARRRMAPTGLHRYNREYHIPERNLHGFEREIQN